MITEQHYSVEIDKEYHQGSPGLRSACSIAQYFIK